MVCSYSGIGEIREVKGSFNTPCFPGQAENPEIYLSDVKDQQREEEQKKLKGFEELLKKKR